jgi:sterol desaturase/sphingolipid hydroxylase (fatty acid hydroxylase superfamily)
VTSNEWALGHEPAEANSNFGFDLPWWDRLLGTYRERIGIRS